jgi:hypothetical protein
MLSVLPAIGLDVTVGSADTNIAARFTGGDVDIVTHDGTNGLKLGGTLVTATAADLNTAASTGKSIAMAIVFG